MTWISVGNEKKKRINKKRKPTDEGSLYGNVHESSKYYKNDPQQAKGTLTDQVAIVDVFVEGRRPSETDEALKVAARKLELVFTTTVALSVLLQFQFETHNKFKRRESFDFQKNAIMPDKTKRNCLSFIIFFAITRTQQIQYGTGFSALWLWTVMPTALTGFYFIQPNSPAAIHTALVSYHFWGSQRACWRQWRKFSRRNW